MRGAAGAVARSVGVPLLMRGGACASAGLHGGAACSTRGRVATVRATHPWGSRLRPSRRWRAEVSPGDPTSFRGLLPALLLPLPPIALNQAEGGSASVACFP